MEKNCDKCFLSKSRTKFEILGAVKMWLVNCIGFGFAFVRFEFNLKRICILDSISKLHKQTLFKRSKISRNNFENAFKKRFR